MSVGRDGSTRPGSDEVARRPAVVVDATGHFTALGAGLSSEVGIPRLVPVRLFFQHAAYTSSRVHIKPSPEPVGIQGHPPTAGDAIVTCTSAVATATIGSGRRP